ncbi:ABC transporter permease [Bacillus swezeyi]|uniref:Nickel import system permease protein NikB n=1 Tax=Bacillus swezeyi TaxID=1925020 RepID=A0A1R1QG40_9BACI|nr:nickel ABC transporter permease [Bacillus swezeyi]MEC1260412.1 ABC transporter permease [Bacillus swezeyi]MED1740815.1 ABC transporter permease [Bacillus swezeyi]MED2929515.1 ABC transporter permease [Bacillus swezeyi]MED2963458.1 ABC transporter permease [Bacillus swezeyi]MED2979278.1 ABC transporter permease [Bacillus swezeyi]
MKQISKRLFELILFLFLLSFISFVFMKAAPGDPVKQMLRVDDVAVTDEQIEEFREELGFNKPIYIQYWNWFKRFFQFDFGHSYTTGEPVIDELSRKFPATLLLTGTSLLVMLLISVPIGTLSALYQDRWIDHIGRLLALIGAALPSFWLGFILIDLFSVRLKWLPSMGAGTFKHLILPSLTLGIAMSGVYVRLVRSSLIESLGQDFVRSARARGISETRIFLFHAFRHCLVPVITIFGVSLGSLLGGTVIIEVLFAYPGVGKLVIDAIIQRDYPIIQGYILFMGVTVVLINLLVDLSYQYLNPEIRLKEAGRR